MKTNELRIGNLVKSTIHLGGSLAERCRFDNDIFQVNKDFIFRDLAEKCQGITLTEEWLLNFGFRMPSGTDSDYLLIIQEDKGGGEGQFEIWVEFNEDNHNKLEYVSIVCPESEWLRTKIKYVHQLQNLYFALTGNELTIKENALAQ